MFERTLKMPFIGDFNLQTLGQIFNVKQRMTYVRVVRHWLATIFMFKASLFSEVNSTGTFIGEFGGWTSQRCENVQRRKRRFFSFLAYTNEHYSASYVISDPSMSSCGWRQTIITHDYDLESPQIQRNQIWLKHEHYDYEGRCSIISIFMDDKRYLLALNSTSGSETSRCETSINMLIIEQLPFNWINIFNMEQNITRQNIATVVTP